MKKVILVLTIIAAFQLTSCSKDNDETPVENSTRLTAASLTTLNNTNWTFNNYTKTPVDSAYEDSITLNFDSLNENFINFNGNNLLNRYFGKFKIDNSARLIIETDQLASTLIGGSDEENAIEHNFLTNLGTNATYFEIKNNELLIYLGDPENSDTNVMVFK